MEPRHTLDVVQSDGLEAVFAGGARAEVVEPGAAQPEARRAEERERLRPEGVVARAFGELPRLDPELPIGVAPPRVEHALLVHPEAVLEAEHD